MEIFRPSVNPDWYICERWGEKVLLYFSIIYSVIFYGLYLQRTSFQTGIHMFCINHWNAEKGSQISVSLSKSPNRSAIRSTMNRKEGRWRRRRGLCVCVCVHECEQAQQTVAAVSRVQRGSLYWLSICWSLHWQSVYRGSEEQLVSNPITPTSPIRNAPRSLTATETPIRFLFLQRKMVRLLASLKRFTMFLWLFHSLWISLYLNATNPQ